MRVSNRIIPPSDQCHLADAVAPRRGCLSNAVPNVDIEQILRPTGVWQKGILELIVFSDKWGGSDRNRDVIEPIESETFMQEEARSCMDFGPWGSKRCRNWHTEACRNRTDQTETYLADDVAPSVTEAVQTERVVDGGVKHVGDSNKLSGDAKDKSYNTNQSRSCFPYFFLNQDSPRKRPTPVIHHPLADLFRESIEVSI